MNDDTLRAALRRALRLEPPAMLSDSLADHRRRVVTGDVEPPAARTSLRLVATSLALAATLAAGGVLVLRNRAVSHETPPPSAGRSVPAVVGSSPTPGLSESRPAAPGATPSNPLASPQNTARASAAASPTATVPTCSAADLSAAVAISGSTYPAGSSIPFRHTITNHAAHPCELPPGCYWEFQALNSAGQVVGRNPGSGACELNPPAIVLQPGTSHVYSSSWASDPHLSSGTYAIRADYDGLGVATGQVQLTAVSSATPTAAPPLVP